MTTVDYTVWPSEKGPGCRDPIAPQYYVASTFFMSLTIPRGKMQYRPKSLCPQTCSSHVRILKQWKEITLACCNMLIFRKEGFLPQPQALVHTACSNQQHSHAAQWHKAWQVLDLRLGLHRQNHDVLVHKAKLIQTAAIRSHAPSIKGIIFDNKSPISEKLLNKHKPYCAVT